MKKTNLPKGTRIHMIGIGGVGMSGLATVMAGMGYHISGSDLKIGHVKERLSALGIELAEGHHAQNVGDAELVVASAAIPADNPEIIAAREKGIPVLTRAQMLGRLMAGTFGIAVSGTHGKTTTTSMLALVLERGGLDPTILIGGDLETLKGNARLGKSRYFLTEACEAYDSFLELHPAVAVITNIEAEHLDHYKSLDGVMAAFSRFLSQVQPGGFAVLCTDCPNTRSLISQVKTRVVTYGLDFPADYTATDISDSPQPSFKILSKGNELGLVTLRIPGRHNVANAVAAAAVASELRIGFDVISKALGEFKGAERRFEILGTAAGIMVVDDYAHHPTEIRATLAAARTLGRRIIAVFQPHLYSRTQQFAREFAEALSEADRVVVTEIYPAREKPIPGVTAAEITNLIRAKDPNKPAKFIADKELIAENLMAELQPSDLVLFMGAGDIRTAGEMLLSLLREAEEKGISK
ncbi:MAG: UDP-N-acetylmuramate--L-alanine ligase [Armatimonadota bacterium]|nr:UDP-N-acetylmuramate--L-alanine ligase [Armatimonadota bacterium]